ncbi:MAG: transcriptional regulator [Bacteroidetes bacterium GWF2_42_66]|nr:MAG: transcriptional regulator [Bacteroidetes bacterium GWA2_42_15]OFX97996.1 MAG: transcriptional regulator [Bacteroidetes bacterium GWE2_42_39]OFY45767.1 MAG: transcriptional regulator [Bacteroidetes bacterium GWF2_42_66]HBL74737.1 XRE family transcriptional regulator [Prolixibacteraceae bacterium]HCR89385.1 XRE family transcriptional regulator [Prolixibacteraceae bacterium]
MTFWDTLMIIELFGKVLRELREANHISQEKLAEYCDLDRTYISLLERGLRQPTITTIFKLANALNISPSKLIEKVEIQDKL